jgi:transposase-like protein
LAVPCNIISTLCWRKNLYVELTARTYQWLAARPARRRFTAEYKLRILQAADRCAEGELGALLRREGLYASHLTIWRKQRETGQLAALAPKKRGRKTDPQAEELARLQRENSKLQNRLDRAELIIDAPKKLLVLLNQPIPEVLERKRDSRWKPWPTTSG